MAKDDYQVLVCYILAYLYDCLKKGTNPEEDELNEVFFQINQKYWVYILSTMSEEGLIRGLKFGKVLSGKMLVGGLATVEITPKGIEMLFDNTKYAKAKRIVQDISDFTSILNLFK